MILTEAPIATGNIPSPNVGFQNAKNGLFFVEKNFL